MGISRANVGRWFDRLDPSAENIAEITKALKQLNPDTARDFVRLYLGDILDEGEAGEEATTDGRSRFTDESPETN